MAWKNQGGGPGVRVRKGRGAQARSPPGAEAARSWKIFSVAPRTVCNSFLPGGYFSGPRHQPAAAGRDRDLGPDRLLPRPIRRTRRRGFGSASMCARVVRA